MKMKSVRETIKEPLLLEIVGKYDLGVPISKLRRMYKLEDAISLPTFKNQIIHYREYVRLLASLSDIKKGTTKYKTTKEIVDNFHDSLYPKNKTKVYIGVFPYGKWNYTTTNK
jgi:hypothetical protein